MAQILTGESPNGGVALAALLTPGSPSAHPQLTLSSPSITFRSPSAHPTSHKVAILSGGRGMSDLELHRWAATMPVESPFISRIQPDFHILEFLPGHLPQSLSSSCSGFLD